MIKLIGITGKARSGKDTLAKLLWNHHDYVRIAFADPLKCAAQTIFGLTEDQTWNDELKEVVIPRWKLTPRQIFQRLGTESVRDVFGPHVWTERWLLSYEQVMNTDNVVIPDVRFENEAKMIRELGGIIIEVRRGDGLAGAEGAHASEAGGIEADYVIDNNGTLETLLEDLNGILRLAEVK